MVDILDFIPCGFSNAITRSDLAFITGASDREIRAAIEAASTREHPIINVGTGYFQPTKHDKEYILQYMHAGRNRIKATAHRLHELEKYLDDKCSNQITLEGMELEDGLFTNL